MAVSRLAFGFLLMVGVASLPEQGFIQVTYDKDHTLYGFSKSMYKGTNVAVTINCQGGEDSEEVAIKWILRMSPCAQEYSVLDKDSYTSYLDYPQQSIFKELYDFTEFMNYSDSNVTCGKDSINLPDLSSQKPHHMSLIENEGKGNESTEGARRKKRDATTAAPTTTTTTAATTPHQDPGAKAGTNVIYKAWTDAYYLLVLQITPLGDSKNFKADVTVRMSGSHGYLSAMEWPLLIFYGVMGLVYIAYGIAWLVLLACNWRDLLRVQFWIGGVILLGMLEKAVFFAEYESINKTGQSVTGAIIFAELVSCLKRALARMLVIIVSLGFGIVKPRLGQAFHKVLCVGALFFVLGTVEGCFRRLRGPSDGSKEVMLAAVPLSVVDAVICWWIFSSLIQTTRTLKLRRNIVKLSLYRHFTNTLIFAILASIAFMIWSITQHKLKECLTDWKELWVDDAFWHLLFSVILLIIMILWRPTANNQRYAFSPLLDAAEDEDDDTVMNDAFDGMKMRSSKTQSNGSPRTKETERNRMDEDLKWVEENIPSSVAEKALPSLLDSDEEIMTTKFEMSKMD